MDDTLAEFFGREQVVASRLYRFAKAVHAVNLGGREHDAGLELPPPSGVAPASKSDSLEKIAAQDPSLKMLVKEILKDDRNNAVSKAALGDSQCMSLLHWWAAYGDFEIRLKRSLGDEAREPPQRRTFFGRAQQACPSAQHFQDARVSVIRGEGGTRLHTLHPIQWYVDRLSEPVWSPYVDNGGVGEMLGLHGTGGWLTPQDVLVDFYDAVTRAAAARFVSAVVTRGTGSPQTVSVADFQRSMKVSADSLGLKSDPCDPCGGEVTLSPCGGWLEEAGKVRLRQEARLAGRPILAISACARPRAYVRFLSDRRDWNGRIASLMQYAKETWSDQEPFGRWLVAATKDPALRVDVAIVALGGLLARALEVSDDGVPPPKERRLIAELGRVLARQGVAVVQSESASRLVAARFSRDGRWALKVDGGQVIMPLGAIYQSTCQDSLFAAVEEYDEYAWSCVTVAEISGRIEWVEAKEALRSADAWGAGWEQLKKRLLDLPMDPSIDELRAPFEATHRTCVRLRASRDCSAAERTPGAVASVVVREADRRLREVVSAIVRLADVRGQDTIGGFYPPRHKAGPFAGDVDIATWLDDPWWMGLGVSGNRCTVRVCGSQSMTVEAGFDEGGGTFTISLPFASEADEALVVCPGAIVWSEDREPPAYVRVIHQCLRPALQAVLGNGGTIDFTDGLTQLRALFATDQCAGTFHELVDQATRGDAVASACLSRLQSDERFNVPCFPHVVEVDGRWQVSAPAPSDSEPSWQFSAQPRDETVKVRFAMTAENATRVISRGPDDGTGLQALAAGVDEWSRSLSDSIRAHASVIVRCSDRHATFGEPLDAGIKAAAALLMVITGAGEKSGGVVLEAVQRDAGFQRLKSWLHAAGAVVEPAEWTAGGGARALPEGAEESAPVFSDDIPEGSMLVMEFAVTTPAGSTYGNFRGCRSAGRPPAHYRDLLVLASVPGGEPFLEWLRRLPAKKLKGGDAFRSDLYDLYYKVSMGHYNRTKDGKPDWDLSIDAFAKAKQWLEEMYETAFECEAFPKEQSVVRVYGEVSPDDVHPLEPGEPEGIVRVVVRGFRSKGKVVKARVSKEPAS